jgi:hypothetical protein
MAQNFQRLILNFFKRFDYEEIKGMRNSVASHISSQQLALLEEKDSLTISQFENDSDFEAYQTHLESNAEFLGEINELTDELCIIALHKKLEIKLNRILLKFYPLLDPKQMHRIDYLKKQLTSLKIDSLVGYSSADELRLINNAIKHSGIVSKSLAKEYSSWTCGLPLSNLDVAFTRLAPGVETYVESLCDAIRTDLKL